MDLILHNDPISISLAPLVAAIYGAAFARTTEICAVVVLSRASCGAIKSCLNPDASTQGQQLRPAIDATSGAEADRLDHCVKEDARMAACTPRQELQSDLNSHVVAACLDRDGRFDSQEGNLCH